MKRSQAFIERCAEKAYIINSTECFGVRPGILPKRKNESGFPVQPHGVLWKQLPSFAKETWRNIVRSVLEEVDNDTNEREVPCQMTLPIKTA